LKGVSACEQIIVIHGVEIVVHSVGTRRKVMKGDSKHEMELSASIVKGLHWTNLGWD